MLHAGGVVLWLFLVVLYDSTGGNNDPGSSRMMTQPQLLFYLESQSYKFHSDWHAGDLKNPGRTSSLLPKPQLIKHTCAGSPVSSNPAGAAAAADDDLFR
jgi:hypothetical protein